VIFGNPSLATGQAAETLGSLHAEPASLDAKAAPGLTAAVLLGHIDFERSADRTALTCMAATSPCATGEHGHGRLRSNSHIGPFDDVTQLRTLI